jgi:hypothetical protein
LGLFLGAHYLCHFVDQISFVHVLLLLLIKMFPPIKRKVKRTLINFYINSNYKMRMKPFLALFFAVFAVLEPFYAGIAPLSAFVNSTE